METEPQLSLYTERYNVPVHIYKTKREHLLQQSIFLKFGVFLTRTEQRSSLDLMDLHALMIGHIPKDAYKDTSNS